MPLLLLRRYRLICFVGVTFVVSLVTSAVTGQDTASQEAVNLSVRQWADLWRLLATQIKMPIIGPKHSFQGEIRVVGNQNELLRQVAERVGMTVQLYEDSIVFQRGEIKDGEVGRMLDRFYRPLADATAVVQFIDHLSEPQRHQLIGTWQLPMPLDESQQRRLAMVLLGQPFREEDLTTLTRRWAQWQENTVTLFFYPAVYPLDDDGEKAAPGEVALPDVWSQLETAGMPGLITQWQSAGMALSAPLEHSLSLKDYEERKRLLEERARTLVTERQQKVWKALADRLPGKLTIRSGAEEVMVQDLLKHLCAASHREIVLDRQAVLEADAVYLSAGSYQAGQVLALLGQSLGLMPRPVGDLLFLTPLFPSPSLLTQVGSAWTLDELVNGRWLRWQQLSLPQQALISSRFQTFNEEKLRTCQWVLSPGFVLYVRGITGVALDDKTGEPLISPVTGQPVTKSFAKGCWIY